MHQNHRKSPSTTGEILDKFYTKAEVVRKCLQKIGNISRKYDLVVEPSAGNGAFFHKIKHLRKIGIDIQPEHKDIIKADWLKYRISEQYKKVLIIGNPPFGRYHKLSTSFIKHALSFANVQTIAFILPNAYHKHTRQRILPPNWRILSITDLGRNAFILDGKEHHVPTSFFLFDKSKGIDLRVNPFEYTDTDDFEFGTKTDFDLFVFGASPKHVTSNPKPNNRGHFLKSKISILNLIKRIKEVNWTGHSSANGGVYWLTKHEFLKQYITRHEH